MTLHEDLELCVPASGPVRSYMEWAIKTTDAEHLFHLGSLLPCVAHECVTAGFRVDPERRFRPTIWSFMIGLPACSKTTTQKRAHGFYRRYLATHLGHEPRDPFILAEGSIPGIFEELAEHYDPEVSFSHGVLVRDEAARLLDGKDAGSTADFLCQLVDGDETIKRHLRGARAENRKQAGSVKDTLKHPAFSGCFATTFDRIRDVTQPGFIEGGLYSRFLWFVGGPTLPDPKMRIEMHDAEQRRVLEEWLEWGKWLLGMQALREPDERMITLDEDAWSLLQSTLFADWERHAKTTSRLNATRKRGLTQATCVAALYALTQQRTSITYDDMVQGVNLVELSTHGLDMLDRTFVSRTQKSNPVTSVLDKAWHTIATAGVEGCTRNVLYRALLVDKATLDRTIETLTDEGSVASATDKPTGVAGRPTTRYFATRADRFGAAPKRVRVSARAHLRLVEPPDSTPPTSVEAVGEPE